MFGRRPERRATPYSTRLGTWPGPGSGRSENTHDVYCLASSLYSFSSLSTRSKGPCSGGWSRELSRFLFLCFSFADYPLIPPSLPVPVRSTGDLATAVGSGRLRVLTVHPGYSYFAQGADVFARLRAALKLHPPTIPPRLIEDPDWLFRFLQTHPHHIMPIRSFTLGAYMKAQMTLISSCSCRLGRSTGELVLRQAGQSGR